MERRGFLKGLISVGTALILPKTEEKKLITDKDIIDVEYAKAEAAKVAASMHTGKINEQMGYMIIPLQCVRDVDIHHARPIEYTMMRDTERRYMPNPFDPDTAVLNLTLYHQFPIEIRLANHAP